MLLRLVTALTLGIAACARAQGDDPQLMAVRDAIAAAENGRLDPSQAATLNKHPLYGWIEYRQSTPQYRHNQQCAGAKLPITLRRPSRRSGIPLSMAANRRAA